MPQARELPGFYYDPEKNRYFPIKGPIPGSSSKTKNPPLKSPQIPSNQERSRSCCRKLRNTTSKLLLARELDGHHVIASRYCKSSFTEEFRKIQASKPTVWKYRGTDKIGISALEHLRVDVQTLEGQSETDVLLTGSINGSLSFSEVGRFGQYFDGGIKWMPDCMKNYVKEKTIEHNVVPGPVFRPNGASLLMSSRISCIRLGPKCTSHAVNDGPTVGHALFTTLGSETSGGSLYTLGLVEPLDLGPDILNTWSRLEEIASFRCTLWTAEYDYNNHRAIIGTNLGGASVDLETGMTSWFLRCKSDVFAQQIVNSGNVILCGLRNGAIVTVDFREKRERFSGRLITHRIPYTPSDKKVGGSNKEWFKLTGDIYPSHTIRMPSSISCLVSLQFDDQYFLASSMDGSMRLYDHRLLHRGAVQSYEGHVNSHTFIQLGVDPAERFVMSGGEDCKLRLWSIKSGELLFEDKFADSVLSTVCYRTYKSGFKAEEENRYKHDSSLGAWLGSHQGLFYMNWL
ncbi:DDB1- and CUL4-associated factor 4 isoform X2 [Abrus precatorius]|uniref:DDB1- and CUL4-associated factor 4 isoform X2 n=1 Tax=Abrus precatorius TaxID=3816 RepID=A0A8B8M3T8_ABRPR|nr:DDB1- and CUL4-associated factor 4 isoform X2 [Abrus precatorius]